MATRFYFPVDSASVPQTGSPPVGINPAVDAAWGGFGGTRQLLRRERSPQAKAITNKNVSETADVATNRCNGQFISNPLKAQTVSGTVKGIFQVEESSTAADMNSQLVIRVLSEDGTTVRGTLLAADDSALSNEWADSYTNRKFPKGWTGAGTALSSVVCQDGDRLVVEVGYRAHNTTTTSRTGRVRFGDSNGTDLQENETQTTAGDSWLEFSADILFKEYPRGASLLGEEFTGTNGDEWDTATWDKTLGPGATIVDIQSNRGRQVVDDTSGSTVRARTDAALTSADFDCIVSYQWNRAGANEQAVHQLVGRRQGDEKRQLLEVYNDSPRVKLAAESAATNKVDDVDANVPAGTDLRWVRWRLEGNRQYAKFWTGVVGDEKSDWDMDWTLGTNDPSAAGKFELQLFKGLNGTGTWDVHWDDLSVREVVAAVLGGKSGFSRFASGSGGWWKGG